MEELEFPSSFFERLEQALKLLSLPAREFRVGPDDEWLSGFAYNISTGGIFIRTLTPLPPLSSVEMISGSF